MRGFAGGRDTKLLLSGVAGLGQALPERHGIRLLSDSTPLVVDAVCGQGLWSAGMPGTGIWMPWVGVGSGQAPALSSRAAVWNGL